MGLSISASAAIIFIASVIVFGNLLTAFDSGENALMDARSASMHRQNDMSVTHMTITGVDRENGTISIVNDGGLTLHVDQVELFLNGNLSNDLVSSRSVAGNQATDLWMSAETLTMHISSDLNGTQVQVVSENGFTAHS